MQDKKLWFRAKRYGWGWYPITWQGWLILLAYVGGIALTDLHAIKITAADTNSSSQFIWNFLPPFFFLSVIMIWVCYKTGEKPGWRWGGKKVGE